MAEGGGRGGHPHPHHVEGHRAADAHAQGGVQAQRAKIVYVMNGWNRFKASRDFMEWFEGLAGDQTVVTLPQSEAFVQAGAAGVSVVEFDRRGKAARATRALVDTVREAAGFPRE